MAYHAFYETLSWKKLIHVILLYFWKTWLQIHVQGDTKKRELLKNPTQIEEIQEKKLLTEIEQLQLAF